MIVTGQIEKIAVKETQWGKYYDVHVNDTKYGIGKKRPAFSDGDWVTFEAEQNEKGYYNADPTTFKKAEPMKAKASTTPAPETRKTWVPDDKRQDSISYQAARNSALAFVDLLLKAEKVDFGKMKGADSIALLETYVDNYTTRFFEDTKNLGHKAEVSVSLGDPNDSLENI